MLAPVAERQIGLTLSWLQHRPSLQVDPRGRAIFQSVIHGGPDDEASTSLRGEQAHH